MKELQTVALGLIVVFLDLPTDGTDWVADPLGWLLVLVGISAVRERLADYGYLQVTAWVCFALSVVTWPPESVPHLDDTLGWVFDLPTLAFCFLLADSLRDVTKAGLSGSFRVISWVYALVTVLPLLVILAEWEQLETPALVLGIAANVAMVLALFSASADDAVLEEGETREGSRDKGAGKGADEPPEKTGGPDRDGKDDATPEGKHKA